MNCQQCKFYYTTDTEIVCRRYPTPKRTTSGWWCGEFKTTKIATKRKKKIQPDWSEKYARFTEVYPRQKLLDKGWQAWQEYIPEHLQDHAIAQAEKYAGEKAGSEAKWIAYPHNWISGGGWKDHYVEVIDPKGCVECGAKYGSGHKYKIVDGNKQYRCEKCRKG